MPISDIFSVFVGTVLMVALFFAGLAYGSPYVAFFSVWSLGLAYGSHWTESFSAYDIDEEWDYLTIPASKACYWGSLVGGVFAVVAAGFMIF